MFKEKAMVTPPKKKDIAINMVLTIKPTIKPKHVVFKEKRLPLKNKSLVDWQEEEKLPRLFKEAIRDV